MIRIETPRILHIPTSLGVDGNEKCMNPNVFEGQTVVITEKLDGESITIYSDKYAHAKTTAPLDYSSHEYLEDMVKKIASALPEGARICGEDLYRTHNIYYGNLKDYFYGLSIWDDYYCWPWDETISFFSQNNIAYPRVLYRGLYDADIITNLARWHEADKSEGFVIRNIGKAFYLQIDQAFGKWTSFSKVKKDAFYLQEPCKKNKVAK